MSFGILILSDDLKKYKVLNAISTYKYEGDISPSMFYEILSLRIENIYVWQGSAVFAFIDSFANEKGLFNYANIPIDTNGHRQRCNVEAISYKDGFGAYYQRKLWLKTIKRNSTDRHKRLSSTSFINFANFFGGEDFESVCKSFKISTEDKAEALRKLILHFNKFIHDITGLRLLAPDGNINYWTIGGISRAFYLRIYDDFYGLYGDFGALKRYQERNPQNKVFEYGMRKAHLLTPGMLYLKDNSVRNNLYKYDKNSLFPSVEIVAPFLGVPIEVPCIERTKTDKFEYIIVYKNLELHKKAGMPAVFKDPNIIYKGKNSDYVFMEEQAFFLRYHDALLNFYDIVDYEEVKFFKLRRNLDKAILTYVNKLYSLKVSAKTGLIDKGHYSVVKYLLNNLHGKFAQLSIVEDYDYKHNSDGIITRQVTKLSDTWQKSHFDYLRGAWIYSTSQAVMLEDLYKFDYCRSKDGNYGSLENHIFYIDTDCIITDCPPSVFGEMFNLSDYALGAYKLEAVYTSFQAYAPKTYAGITETGEIKLTVAGMKKNEIIAYCFAQHMDATNILSYLSSCPELPCTILKRTPTGCEYVTEWRPLGKGFNIDDEEASGVLYDCDNFII